MQEQVHAELQAAGLAASSSAGGGPGRPYDTADWAHLPLLAAVTKEALRLCPPAPFGGTRQVVVEEGADVCGYHLRKVWGWCTMGPGRVGWGCLVVSQECCLESSRIVDSTVRPCTCC